MKQYGDAAAKTPIPFGKDDHLLSKTFGIIRVDNKIKRKAKKSLSDVIIDRYEPSSPENIQKEKTLCEERNVSSSSNFFFNTAAETQKEQQQPNIISSSHVDAAPKRQHPIIDDMPVKKTECENDANVISKKDTVNTTVNNAFEDLESAVEFVPDDSPKPEVCEDESGISKIIIRSRYQLRSRHPRSPKSNTSTTESSEKEKLPFNPALEHVVNKNIEKTGDGHKQALEICDVDESAWKSRTINDVCQILLKNICFFERGIIAFNKPYGISVIGGPGISLSLAHVFPFLISKLDNSDVKFIHPVHRLDKSTTGVLLCAYTSDAEKRLRELFLANQVIKRYFAITKGIPFPFDGEINIPLTERYVCGRYKMMLAPRFTEKTEISDSRDSKIQLQAITKYKVIDQWNKCSLILAQPVTGVKHQVRSHLSYALNCPILGDHKYSHFEKFLPQVFSHNGFISDIRLQERLVFRFVVLRGSFRYFGRMILSLESSFIAVPIVNEQFNIEHCSQRHQ